MATLIGHRIRYQSQFKIVFWSRRPHSVKSTPLSHLSFRGLRRLTTCQATLTINCRQMAQFLVVKMVANFDWPTGVATFFILSLKAATAISLFICNTPHFDFLILLFSMSTFPIIFLLFAIILLKCLFAQAKSKVWFRVFALTVWPLRLDSVQGDLIHEKVSLPH